MGLRGRTGHHVAFVVLLMSFQSHQSALPASVVLSPPLFSCSSLPCFASPLACTRRAATLLTTKLHQSKCHGWVCGRGAVHIQTGLGQSSDHRLPLHTHCRVYRNSPSAAKPAGASHLFRERPPTPNPGAAIADSAGPCTQRTPPPSSNCTSLDGMDSLSQGKTRGKALSALFF